ncbi:MAG: alpha-ribazole phosphatase [Thermodesulfovibrio sp.]|nr:alpha-ribazole phosphatase [Thermodesulfovibrio sp.]
MKPDIVLYLLRHGETEGYKRAYKGHIDIPLSKSGEKQAYQIAKFLREYSERYELKKEVVYSSPLSRAKKTADILAEELSVPLEIRENLKERSFGKWEGLTINDIVSLYPEEFERWRRNPLKFSPPEGESTEDVSKRAKAVLREIVDTHNSSQIFIVAHGGINRVIICNILEIPLENIFRIEQEFACVNIIEFYGQNPVVKLINGVFWK